VNSVIFSPETSHIMQAARHDKVFSSYLKQIFLIQNLIIELGCRVRALTEIKLK